MTYTYSTDIREVTARLSTSKVSASFRGSCYSNPRRYFFSLIDTQELCLNCMVNRDLTRRIKAASGATWSRKAIHSDLKRALQLIRLAYSLSPYVSTE